MKTQEREGKVSGALSWRPSWRQEHRRVEPQQEAVSASPETKRQGGSPNTNVGKLVGGEAGNGERLFPVASVSSSKANRDTLLVPAQG